MLDQRMGPTVVSFSHYPPHGISPTQFQVLKHLGRSAGYLVDNRWRFRGVHRAFDHATVNVLVKAGLAMREYASAQERLHITERGREVYRRVRPSFAEERRQA